MALEQREGPAGDALEIPMEGDWAGPLVPDTRARHCHPHFHHHPLFYFLQCRKLWFCKNQVTHPESDGIGIRRHKPYTNKTEPGLLDRPVKPTAQEEEAGGLPN